MPKRPINKRERALLGRMRKRKRKNGIPIPPNYVEYMRQGNFTICLAYYDDLGPDPAVGAAKRLPSDKPNAEIGCDIAFARAITFRASPIII